MAQAIGVAQLMHRLLDRPLVEQGLVLGQTVETLTQARQSNHSRRSTHPRLAEDEVKARGV